MKKIKFSKDFLKKIISEEIQKYEESIFTLFRKKKECVRPIEITFWDKEDAEAFIKDLKGVWNTPWQRNRPPFSLKDSIGEPEIVNNKNVKICGSDKNEDEWRSSSTLARLIKKHATTDKGGTPNVEGPHSFSFGLTGLFEESAEKVLVVFKDGKEQYRTKSFSGNEISQLEMLKGSLEASLREKEGEYSVEIQDAVSKDTKAVSVLDSPESKIS